MPEAVALFEQVRDARMKQFGPDHPVTLATLQSLAKAHRVAGETTRAIASLEQVARRSSEAARGRPPSDPGHPAQAG